jgi:hypothetical protein
MDAIFDNFYSKLTQLNESIAHINMLLKEDKVHFNKNDLVAISASDAKKQDLLNIMSQQALQLRNCLPDKQHGETASSLETYLNQLQDSQAEKAASLIKQLQERIAEGYEYITGNNNIVVANLGYVKEIWDRLSGLAQDNTGTYEKPSNPNK